MKTQITYIASSGNRYNLTANGVLHRTANYYNWTWDVVGTNLQYGVRVSDFSRKPAEYDAEIIVYGTPTERRRFLQALHNDFENDLRKKKPGRIVWGKYYIDCYVRQSQTNPEQTWNYLSNKIHIYAPYPFWVQEKQITLSTSNEQSSEFLDFPINFPFDFTAPTIRETAIKSDFPFASEFEMVIFGPAVNPRVTINWYSYVLYTTIPDGAYVVIDSRKKTVMQFNTDGTQSNIFNLRNKTDSVFKKIPGGNLRISWDATFGADITIFQEKSEPEFEEVVE